MTKQGLICLYQDKYYLLGEEKIKDYYQVYLICQKDNKYQVLSMDHTYVKNPMTINHIDHKEIVKVHIDNLQKSIDWDRDVKKSFGSVQKEIEFLYNIIRKKRKNNNKN